MEAQNKKRLRFSYFAAISVNIMTILSGYGFAWSSACIPKLKGEENPAFNPLPHPATVYEISWITSLHNLGALCGPLFAGTIADKIGKKRTLLLFSIPQMLSNILLIFANDVKHFYAARFLTGMGTGCVFTIIPPYVAEITQPKHRGRTSIFISLMIVAAQLTVWFVGPYVSIKTLATAFLAPSVLFILIFGGCVPESPRYFVMRNEMDKAQQALLKSGATNAQTELDDILRELEKSESDVRLSDFFASRAAKKSLLVSQGLMFFQQFSGHAGIASYQSSIFSAKGSGERLIATAGPGLVQLITALFIFNIVDRVRRKKLLLLSYLAQLASLLGLGVYFYLQDNINADMAPYSWLSILCILVNMSAFKIGAGPISWTITAEIFPPKLKYYMGAAAAFSMTFFGFIANFLFPIVSVRIGMLCSFVAFACIVVCAILFIVYVVPETKGKSLPEIQNMLEKGKGGQVRGQGRKF